MNKKLFCLIALGGLLSFGANAQVTIGTGLAPSKGALLDLKTETDGSSKLGLGLPRVELTDLAPTSNADLAKSIGNPTGSYDMAEHVGLLVYNVKDVEVNPATCATTGAPIGMYVWDGSNWQGLSIQGPTDQFAENIDPVTGIGTVTDYEGNVYPTKRWTSTDGTKISGIWMTKNLYSTRKVDGTFIDCPNGLHFNPAYNYNASGGVIVKGPIPAGTVGDYTSADIAVTGQSYADYVKDFGLLYTHGQALDACPHGWHIPTNAEWDLLAESMDGIKSGNDYQFTAHILKMYSNKTFVTTDGYSIHWGNLNTPGNGFNGLPSGIMLNDGAMMNFGAQASWWSASSGADIRNVSYIDAQLNANTGGTDGAVSVRCVKN